MGTLYLVATPIGNLEDITLRALRVLKEVSLIAAEDTRSTGLLKTRFEIDTPVTSYYEANKLAKLSFVLDALSNGDVALISDAGMPGLSDPGYELVRAAIREGYLVVPVPGASAPVTALVVSGLPTDSFVYLGFLPRRPSDRRRVLRDNAQERRTLVFFETPHRLRDCLADIESIMGERAIAVCRELTKLYEEVLRGSVSEILDHFAEVKPRGEFTIVLGGAAAEERWPEECVREALDTLLSQGVARTTAAKQVASQSGWRRREVYDLGLCGLC